MMSKKEAYLGLMAALTQQHEDEPALLMHFDWYNQQDQELLRSQDNRNEDDEIETFAFPAAFMEFTGEIPWEQRGAGLKEAYTDFTLIVLQEQPQDTHSHEHENIVLEGLSWMDELAMLIKKCEKTYGDCFQKIKHVATVHDHHFSLARRTELKFKILLRDASRKKRYTKVKLEPRICEKSPN